MEVRRNQRVMPAERRRKSREMKKLNEWVWDFIKEEDAVGVVEIILILVVLIGLVIIFKEQITNLVNSLLSKIAKQSNSI